MRGWPLACVGLLAVAGCNRSGTSVGGEGGAPSPIAQGLSFLTGGKFEGEITSEVSMKKGASKGDLVFGIKSPKVRIDGVGALDKNDSLATDGYILLDPPDKKGWLISPSRKQAMYAAFDKNQPIRFAGKTPAGAPPVPEGPPKVDKTGIHNTVAGYDCEEWRLTTKKSRADVCVAEGISWIDLSDSMEWPELSVAAVLAEANRFPLRVVTYDDKNQETARMIAKKVEKKALDDARFVVPAGFQQIDLQAVQKAGAKK